MDFTKLTNEMSEVKVELKYIVESLNELKSIQKITSSLIERQNHISDRMSKIENLDLVENKDLDKLALEVKVNSDKIRKLEDWRLTIVIGAGTVGALIGPIINKLLSKFI